MNANVDPHLAVFYSAGDLAELVLEHARKLKWLKGEDLVCSIEEDGGATVNIRGTINQSEDE